MNPTKYLWVNTDGQNGWLWKSLAIGLGKRFGLRPLLIVQSEQDKKLHLAQKPLGFDGEIIVRDDIYGFVVRGGDTQESDRSIFEAAAEIERKYGIALVRDILASDRHLGRGYMLGGKGYGVSATSRATTFANSIAACVRIFAQAERLMDDYPPGLMLGLSGQHGIFGRPFAEVCRRKGIPIRCLESARLGDIFYWSDDIFENSAAFMNHFAGQPEPTDDEIAAVRQRIIPNTLHTSLGAQARYRKSIAFAHIFRSFLIHFARYFYGRIRGYRKAMIGTSPRDRIRQVFSTIAQIHFLDRNGVRDLSRYADRTKVWFPLQTEPELTTTCPDVYLPNQMAIIHDLAISLPPGAVLFVKEHIWQIGQRDIHFYRTLIELPNVVLVHHDIRGVDLVKQCDLVCTMTGSSGHEAAMLGIPVIRYGQQGIIFALSHVHRANGRGDMDLLRKLLVDKDPESARARVRAGAKFALAMEGFGFDLSKIDFFARRSALTDSELDDFYRHLSRTLDSVEFDRAA